MFSSLIALTIALQVQTIAFEALLPAISSPPATLQDKPKGAEPPPLPAPPGASTDAPVLDSEGHPVLPGVIPKSTSQTARELWERVLQASFAHGERRPVTAFDLALDVRYKASIEKTNDFPNMRYLFLAPGYVRVFTGNQREEVRGPEGDWLIDRKRNETVRLTGRENAEDRRQLDETLSIARNFIALTDPGSLRILSLSVLERAPEMLPQSKAKRASELAWLELRTPDFRLANAKPRSAEGSPIVRVDLGIDRKDAWVEFVLVVRDVAGFDLDESSVLIQLENPLLIDGLRVPQQILVFGVDATRRPIMFQAEPGSDLYLKAKSSRLRAELSPGDFLPK